VTIVEALSKQFLIECRRQAMEISTMHSTDWMASFDMGNFSAIAGVD
jgi:hypothetical protein